MSEYIDISFINIYSLEQFLEEARKIRETETLVFYIKEALKIQDTKLATVFEIANFIRETNSIVILIVDNIVDYTILDCIISADICFVTNNGKCNIQSEYTPTGIYTKEQIKYLLANDADDLFVNDVDAMGNFLNGALVTEILEDLNTEEQLVEYVKSFVNSLTLGKKMVQMKRIKEYFNSFKSLDWSQRKNIMNLESRNFCYLARQVGEV